MTVTLASAQQQLLLHETAPLARLIKITRKDTQVLRWCDWGHDLEYVEDDGNLYTYEPDYSPSWEAVRMEEGIRRASIQANGFTVDAAGVDPEEVRQGRWDRAIVEMFVVHATYAWAGALRKYKWWVYDLVYSGEKWTFTLRNIAGQIERNIGRVYTRRCDATLYDSRCGVNPSLFQTLGTVTAVSGWADAHPRMRFRTDITGVVDKWFKDGTLVWTSGPNLINGLQTYDVKNFWSLNGEIELWTETPFDIQVGDTFAAFAGCNKLAQVHCRQKFNNITNHRGFPWMPTIGRVLKTPNAKF